LPRAVQQEISRHRLLLKVPLLATIKRWLCTTAITHPAVTEWPFGY